MRTLVSAFWLTTLAAALAIPQATITTTKKKAASPKSAASGKATSKTGKTARSGKASSKTRAAAAPTTPRRYGQQVPTPDRYRDIQSALAAKGYLHGEPTGVWDSDSVDAMRRFQEDQKLPATGKITASALTGLGLGPNTPNSRIAPTVNPPPVTLPADSPPPPAPPQP